MTDPQPLFNGWCSQERKESRRKMLLQLVASKSLPQSAIEQLALRARSHYVSDGHIEAYLNVLGYENTAETLRCLYPRTPRARSGDLGEILGTEAVEEHCGYRVPVRKLRYADHREQPMRGEDIIGVRDMAGDLGILKGEAKSAEVMSRSVIESARSGLEENDGRPSSHALIFVANRLLDSASEPDRALGEAIVAKCVESSMTKQGTAHYIFALTGNRAKALASDLQAADESRDQFVVQLQVHDQPKFVRHIYTRLNRLALDRRD